VVIDRRHLQQHLELAAQAYGPDLPLPTGTVAPRAAAPTPAPAAPPAEAAAEAPVRPAVPAAVAAPARPAAAIAATVPATPPPAAVRAAPTAASDDPVAQLQALRHEVLPCTRCKLHQGRQHTVFGEGNPRARVMFIGEAPGAREDQSGRPFVGDAGQLLDRIITGAMGLQRQDVYIANINKCRPPGNRVPEPDEVAACLPFLRQQVEIVRPEVLVCLGRTAAQNLLGTTASTTALRGRELEYLGIPVVVTWHPAYLLREPAHKRETWEDIKRVNRLLGRPEVPPPTGT
jgi:uracil-DNA glycosylase family 4